MSWAGFAVVFAAFFLTHSIPVHPPIRTRLTGIFGTRGFTLGYSALSLAMLAFLIRAAGQAPYVQLWPQMPWQRHAVHLGMLAVCLILALSVGRPNPFSFGGSRNDRFDPARPGLIRWSRHPILLALIIWAGMHLVANGDLAHVILFGLLGSFAMAGRLLIDRRKRRDLGEDRWQTLDAARREAAVLPIPLFRAEVAGRMVIGLGLFVGLLWAHPHLIGVPAL
ncbi:putative membrane protein [Rhodovulum imhoffii]|uniref:Putative membrane protein n=1 Tax=Rhodovulum imhoffii TaxID=365340 RepID=A0A2T5BQW1_9RHOB|nr:NnrU family protein [Rhodovulum imhoffii]MBK5932613.1 NnrU family protein [Rhodovulum imhoffii]PTN01604.1 putative membrane protein [Rhodovulum imhoffii]